MHIYTYSKNNIFILQMKYPYLNQKYEKKSLTE